MRRIVIIIGALALTACMQTGLETGSEDALDASETMMPVEPDGSIGDGATPLPELVEPETTGPNEGLLEEDARRDAVARGIGPNAIPADYHGAWDYANSECAIDSDGRITITGDQVAYHESVGKVQAINARPNGDKVVTLLMSGEGVTWERNLLLELDSRAMRMVISDLGGGPQIGNALKRCD